jgi:hypothetical protein
MYSSIKDGENVRMRKRGDRLLRHYDITTHTRMELSSFSTRMRTFQTAASADAGPEAHSAVNLHKRLLPNLSFTLRTPGRLGKAIVGHVRVTPCNAVQYPSERDIGLRASGASLAAKD